ncbi:hypothetical protein HYW40_00030 [Candidatus Curtissbacteria bacterium]|nr:hypothetical protein [Candidatus Curtissbacteria bacterium]
MRVVSVCLVSFLLFFYTLAPARAAFEIEFPQVSDGQINEALLKTVPLRLIPSNPFYFLISVKEAILWSFQPSSAKRTELDMVLAGKRLKESYLLVNRGDIKNASTNMTRYAQKIGKMTGGLAKARLQKQDVSTLVSEIAEDMKSHEVLFFAIKKRAEGLGDDYGFSKNYNSAAAAFVDAVAALDNFRPGIKDRFKSASESAEVRKTLFDSAPKSPGFIEASPSVKPRKIIY